MEQAAAAGNLDSPLRRGSCRDTPDRVKPEPTYDDRPSLERAPLAPDLPGRRGRRRTDAARLRHHADGRRD
ncbi:MAG TPA: hypothetical protein DGP25_09240, partial [Brevundimonas sp.]|nr:hypothetical protein [Brevundimonas sp.]